MQRASLFIFCASILALPAPFLPAEPFKLDPISQQQADLEQKLLAENAPRTQIAAIIEFRKTAQHVQYPAGQLKLPGWLYLPTGEPASPGLSLSKSAGGPYPAVIWNHGSEKLPVAQAELARFYTQHGFAFFEPIREGHGNAPGDYILDMQKQIFARKRHTSARRYRPAPRPLQRRRGRRRRVAQNAAVH